MHRMVVYRSLTRPAVRPLEMALVAHQRVGQLGVIPPAPDQTVLSIHMFQTLCITIETLVRLRHLCSWEATQHKSCAADTIPALRAIR